MYTRVPTAGLSHEEWLELRRTGIGGSDAAAVCGLNPYSSPMKVYLDKTGAHTENEDTESLRQGRDLEEYVAQRFMEATGLKVRRSNFMYRSVEHPFMIADVDRLIVGEDAGLECKTASAFNADKWKDGNVPIHYLLQCIHYMAVTGKRTWYIAVVLLGRGFQYRRIEWDEKMIQKLVAAEEAFWETHVVPGVLPQPDGSEACNEILGQYFHTARKGSELTLQGFDGKLKRREEIISQISRLQKEQNQIEQEVKLYMKDNETAVNNNYRISWANVDTSRLDSKRLKEERPEVYQDYLKTTTSRRFQIKAA